MRYDRQLHIQMDSIKQKEKLFKEGVPLWIDPGVMDDVIYSPLHRYGHDGLTYEDRVRETDSSRRIFIDPFSDRGFKHLFSKPESKFALMSLLNSVLEGREAPIVDIEYVNTEQIPEYANGRKTVFDIYCITKVGEHIIIEVQSTYQKYYIDRLIHYMTKPILRQEIKGKWNYKLKKIYVVSFLDHRMKPPLMISKQVVSSAGFYLDRTLEKLTDKLAFIFIEAYNFHKTENDLKTMQDRWLYTLKHMRELDEVPASLQREPFTEIFERARISNMTEKEIEQIDVLKKERWDRYGEITSALDYGRKEGHAEGHAEGRAEGHAEGREEGLEEGRAEGDFHRLSEIVIRLFKNGHDAESIASLLGEPLSNVNKILEDQQNDRERD